MPRPATGALALLLTLAGAAPDAPPPKPLPGNKPCPYPSEAQRQYVAGPVHFVAQVRSDGAVESVEVGKVPLPNLGFEDTVRACISTWRFEQAPTGETALRGYEGVVRFQLDVAEERAIRTLLEALAAAWNAGDMKTLEDLALRPGDAEAIPPREAVRSLAEQLQAGSQWRMQLEPDVEQLRFLRPDIVSLTQPYRRLITAGNAAQTGIVTLDAMAIKGSRGWRFAIVSPMKPVRVGSSIREPRKVKDFKPRYPEVAKEARVQGVVILECVVSPEGKITDVKIIRGIPLLNDAAVEAVRHWEYTPTLLDGKPVSVIMTVTVNFKLR